MGSALCLLLLSNAGILCTCTCVMLAVLCACAMLVFSVQVVANDTVTGNLSALEVTARSSFAGQQHACVLNFDGAKRMDVAASSKDASISCVSPWPAPETSLAPCMFGARVPALGLMSWQPRKQPAAFHPPNPLHILTKWPIDYPQDLCLLTDWDTKLPCVCHSTTAFPHVRGRSIHPASCCRA